jgi:hypothetical protein
LPSIQPNSRNAIQKRLPQLTGGVLFRANQKHSDPPYLARRLLRARRERKTGRAAEKRDELAPSHWAPNGKRLVRVEV